MNVNIHLAICGILTLILVASFLYRKFIDDHDDHNIHLANTPTDVRTISVQVEHSKRIETLDRLNKYLTVVVVAYLLVIGSVAFYTGWMAPGQN